MTNETEILRAERRNARVAAVMFESACISNNAEMLYDAADLLNNTAGWRLAFMKVSRLPTISPQIQEAFLGIWIESKMLPLLVGDRPVLAKALRMLFPSGYRGDPLLLFRGAGAMERTRRTYGFSWTTDVARARGFAEHWRDPNGVVLQTIAPADAILKIRKPENHYDEEEVIVDPFRLNRIEVVERLT